MELKLHYLPELPTKSCWVMVVYKSEYRKVSGISNIEYSAKHHLFNFNDRNDPKKDNFYFDTDCIAAWEYWDEFTNDFIEEAES